MGYILEHHKDLYVNFRTKYPQDSMMTSWVHHIDTSLQYSNNITIDQSKYAN
jgi:hypothetical protein